MVRPFALASVVLAALLLAAEARQSGSGQRDEAAAKPHSPAAARFEQHVQFIRSNGTQPQPSPQPTVFTDEEGNAWFAEGGLKLPAGIEKLTYTTTPGAIVADSVVDFDQLTAGKHSANPLLLLFSGKHDVEVKATASGKHGTATVHVESASLDGTPIPRSALQFFVDRYVKPKYPKVGLDTQFAMPDRIETATVETGKVVLVQK
jgi:hypothetical protein